MFAGFNEQVRYREFCLGHSLWYISAAHQLEALMLLSFAHLLEEWGCMFPDTLKQCTQTFPKNNRTARKAFSLCQKLKRAKSCHKTHYTNFNKHANSSSCVLQICEGLYLSRKTHMQRKCLCPEVSVERFNWLVWAEGKYETIMALNKYR